LCIYFSEAGDLLLKALISHLYFKETAGFWAISLKISALYNLKQYRINPYFKEPEPEETARQNAYAGVVKKLHRLSGSFL
jgi:hypothetical protein